MADAQNKAWEAELKRQVTVLETGVIQLQGLHSTWVKIKSNV